MKINCLILIYLKKKKKGSLHIRKPISYMSTWWFQRFCKVSAKPLQEDQELYYMKLSTFITKKSSGLYTHTCLKFQTVNKWNIFMAKKKLILGREQTASISALIGGLAINGCLWHTAIESLWFVCLNGNPFSIVVNFKNKTKNMEFIFWCQTIDYNVNKI